MINTLASQLFGKTKMNEGKKDWKENTMILIAPLGNFLSVWFLVDLALPV